MKYRKEEKILLITLPSSTHTDIKEHFSGVDYKKACWVAHKIYNACYAMQKSKDAHQLDNKDLKMPMRICERFCNGWSAYNYDAIKQLVDDGKLSEEIFEPYTGDSEYLRNQFDMYGYRWEIMFSLPFVAISSYTLSAVVDKDYKRILNRLEALGIIKVFVGSEKPENPKAKYPRLYLWCHNLPDKITSSAETAKTIKLQDDGVCWRAYLFKENALPSYIVANPNVRYVVEDLYKMRLSEEFLRGYKSGGYEFLMRLFAGDYERKAEKKYRKLSGAEKKKHPTLADYKESYTISHFIKDIADDIVRLVEYAKTPAYAKHRYISTCKANRIYSPLSDIYSGLRPDIRTKKIKRMASIDLKASIPTILAELMHRDGVDCEFTRLIANHQDIYVVMQERLGLADRNEAKQILNTCINSDRWSKSMRKLEKAFPEVAEYIISYRKSFTIPDEIKEDIRRWVAQDGRGNAKYKLENKPQTPYRQHYLLSSRGGEGGDYLWENTIHRGSFYSKRRKKHVVPINTPNEIHTLTYRHLFSFESQLMQKTVARIKQSDVGDKTDVLLLHDAILFDADHAKEVKRIVEAVVWSEFQLFQPVIADPVVYSGGDIAKVA